MDSGVSSGAGWPHFLSLSNETSLPTTTTIILSTPTPQHALELSVNSYSFSISCQSLPMHTLLQRTSPTLPSGKPHLFQRTRYEGPIQYKKSSGLVTPQFPRPQPAGPCFSPGYRCLASLLLVCSFEDGVFPLLVARDERKLWYFAKVTFP